MADKLRVRVRGKSESRGGLWIWLDLAWVEEKSHCK